MPQGLTLHFYGLCRDDAALLPFFFRHYDAWIDHYFLFDAGSVDGSVELMSAHPQVTVLPFAPSGDSLIEAERQCLDQVWQGSRGQADFVVIADLDEHLYRPAIVDYLLDCRARGITAIRSFGFELVADALPEGEVRLLEVITQGRREASFDRLSIFDPVAISATRYGPRRVRAWPEGHVVWPESSEVLALHFTQLGVDYVTSRMARQQAALKPADLASDWSARHHWSAEQIAAHWSAVRSEATTVPGLGERAQLAPGDYRGDERWVEECGLLDADWYLAANPDVRDDGVDPLVHFCQYGWREGRRPNPYFDTRWYGEVHAAHLPAGVNPLLHYVRSGEALGLDPSPHFDAPWYRAQHALEPDENALRHFLLRRGGGEVSPLPSFDVASYLEQHPELRAQGADPYEHFLRRSEADPASAQPAAFPGFRQLAALLGVDPDSPVRPAQVSWQQLTEVIRQFLLQAPFDSERYLATHPDVADAVRAGEVSSAREHWVQFGYFEGRDGAFPHDGPQP